MQGELPGRRVAEVVCAARGFCRSSPPSWGRSPLGLHRSGVQGPGPGRRSSGVCRHVRFTSAGRLSQGSLCRRGGRACRAFIGFFRNAPSMARRSTVWLGGDSHLGSIVVQAGTGDAGHFERASPTRVSPVILGAISVTWGTGGGGSDPLSASANGNVPKVGVLRNCISSNRSRLTVSTLSDHLAWQNGRHRTEDH